MMQQQDDSSEAGAYHGAVGVLQHPPMILGPSSQFNPEHRFPPGSSEMLGFPQMQGAGPEISMQGYGQPALDPSMAFAGSSVSELPHNQLQGMQHVAFHGMPADPNMAHMMMHFPTQRMQGHWPGYNGMVSNGLTMPVSKLPPPEGAMYQTVPSMIHQHPGYPVVANMNAQSAFPPMNGSIAHLGHPAMMNPAVDNQPPLQAPSSGVELVEQLMANSSSGPSAPKATFVPCCNL
jgi:hypothetical protein